MASTQVEELAAPPTPPVLDTAAMARDAVAARCNRLIRLKDGVVIDDTEIAAGHPVEETIRRAGQLG